MSNIPFYEKNAEGKKVVIIGAGAVGLGVMEFFTLRKADVTVIEMMPAFGKDLDVVSKSTFHELLIKHPVNMHFGYGPTKGQPPLLRSCKRRRNTGISLRLRLHLHGTRTGYS